MSDGQRGARSSARKARCSWRAWPARAWLPWCHEGGDGRHRSAVSANQSSGNSLVTATIEMRPPRATHDAALASLAMRDARVPPISNGGQCTAGCVARRRSQGVSTGTMPSARAEAALRHHSPTPLVRVSPRALGERTGQRRSHADGAHDASPAAIVTTRSTHRPSESCVSQASSTTQRPPAAVTGSGGVHSEAACAWITRLPRYAGRPVAKSTSPVVVSIRRPQRRTPTVRGLAGELMVFVRASAPPDFAAGIAGRFPHTRRRQCDFCESIGLAAPQEVPPSHERRPVSDV